MKAGLLTIRNKTILNHDLLDIRRTVPRPERKETMFHLPISPCLCWTSTTLPPPPTNHPLPLLVKSDTHTSNNAEADVHIVNVGRPYAD